MSYEAIIYASGKVTHYLNIPLPATRKAGMFPPSLRAQWDVVSFEVLLKHFFFIFCHT